MLLINKIQEKKEKNLKNGKKFVGLKMNKIVCHKKILM